MLRFLKNSLRRRSQAEIFIYVFENSINKPVCIKDISKHLGLDSQAVWKTLAKFTLHEIVTQAKQDGTHGTPRLYSIKYNNPDIEAYINVAKETLKC